MNFIMSTPTKYVEALKKENVTWPEKTGNFFNEFKDEHIKQGSFSSRADFKK